MRVSSIILLVTVTVFYVGCLRVPIPTSDQQVSNKKPTVVFTRVASVAASPTPTATHEETAASKQPPPSPTATQPSLSSSKPVLVAAARVPAQFAVQIIQRDASPLSWGYDKSTLTASVGDKVSFTNSGSIAHEVASDDGSFDTGNLNSGDSWSFSPTKPGTFAFYCVPHPWMKGTLIVQLALANNAPSSTIAATQPPAASSSSARSPALMLRTSDTLAQTSTALAQTAPQVPAAVAPPAAPKNLSPYDAAYTLDNVQRTIPANTSLWFKFDYGGDNSPIAITMPNGTNSGFGFKIYHAYQAKRVYQDNVNMGMGTSANGSQDLTWVGATIEPGAYYIEVFNTNSTPQNFVIQIVGTAIDIYGK